MEYAVKPEEHELRSARQVVEGAMEACKAAMDKQKDLQVGIAWGGDDLVKQDLGGANSTEVSPEFFSVEFNSSVEGWKDRLKTVVAREYAHSCFLEQTEGLEFKWQTLLFEAHAYMFAEKMYPGKPPRVDEFSDKELEDLWPVVREALSENSDWGSLFQGSERFPRWLGYAFAYHIGEKLMIENYIDDFPELKRSDVVKAGDEMFAE
ncbi:MAG: DUF2268 domain-containing putative Zn-dependent protease [Candidatus Nanohaloarchaea archaeon]|nr:DUF2268 domain-containing putative Zn-dependent protease [Candidatus Nanohaloarchaea archaeon]